MSNKNEFIFDFGYSDTKATKLKKNDNKNETIIKTTTFHKNNWNEVGLNLTDDMFKSIDGVNIYFLNTLKSCDWIDNTDLIPGVYEGGFKVWQTSLDLLDYLNDSNNKHAFNNKDVCELGCGAGLSGIFAILNDANKVMFHDYNEEVIDNFTKYNIYYTINKKYNNQSMKILNNTTVQLLSGDWRHLINNCQIMDNSFDIILMSEVLYSSDIYEILIETLNKLLKNDDKSYILLSSKSHYFGGTNGSLQLFLELLSKHHFTHEIKKEIHRNVKSFIIQIKRHLKE